MSFTSGTADSAFSTPSLKPLQQRRPVVGASCDRALRMIKYWFRKDGRYVNAVKRRSALVELGPAGFLWSRDSFMTLNTNSCEE